MRNTVYLIAISTFASSLVSKDKSYIWFPSEIGIVQNCDQNEVIANFEISTNSKEKIEVHSFGFVNSDYNLIVNGKEISESDTIYLSKKHPFEFRIKFKLDSCTRQNKFRFKTNKDHYLENYISINYGAYNLTSESIRNGGEHIVHLSESCNDSLIVHFPYGGTVSGASLSMDSVGHGSTVKSVSYGLREEQNYLVFSKEEKGRYYVRYSSCHWGNEFWITIK